MQNTWIVVPIISNDYDLTEFVNSLTISSAAPETYKKMVLNPATSLFDKVDEAHPYFGQNSESFLNRVIFINTKPGYTQYNGVVHLEDFNEINIYRYLNAGIDYAKSNGADSIILLNGALDIDPFIFHEAHKQFLNSGKKVINVCANAVILVSADYDLKFNDHFQIWFGDHEFYLKADELGEVAYADTNFWQLKYIIPQNITESFDDIVKMDEEKWNSRPSSN